MPEMMFSQKVVTPVETGVQRFFKYLKNWIPAPAPDPIRGSPE
jgi:hypothetical protein